MTDGVLDVVKPRPVGSVASQRSRRQKDVKQFSSEDYKLCYIEGSTAYFTTQALSDQWGDDWNDAPYEHNAGSPYYFSEYDAKQGRKEWDILIVGFRVGMETPEQIANGNSRYSVESINRGDTAWLLPYSGYSGKAIHAGVNLLEFQRLIKENGGEILVSPDKHYLFHSDAELDPLQLMYQPTT